MAMIHEDFEVFLDIKRRLALRGIVPRDYVAATVIGDRIDAELMLNVTRYPNMLGTALAQQMNPDFQMPRPLARIAPKFLKIRFELRS
jgi:hypothetical protein